MHPRYPQNFGISGKVADLTFDKLLEHFKPYIVHLAEHYGGNFSSPEDIQQELTITLWKCLDKYREKPPGEFVALIRTSMNNRIADLARKKIPSNFSDCPNLDDKQVELLFAGNLNDSGFYERSIIQVQERGSDQLKQHMERLAKDNVKPRTRTKKLLELIGDAITG